MPPKTETKDSKAKDKERAAKQKEKERAAKQKEKERAAKEKEKAAKQKEKEKAAKQKEKERAAKQKEKDRAAKQKEKERAAKQKEKDRAAKQKAAGKKDGRAPKRHSGGGSKSAAKDDDRAAAAAAEETAPADAGADDVVQPVEEVAVEERGEADEVPAEVRERADAAPDVPSIGEIPDNDKTVRPLGYIAETLGKEDAVTRSTQRATLAASYTTRDHDVIRAWAESRGGQPADVEGTGRKGAGVLRIQFPDGPGDDSRLEAVDWTSYFQTFDESDVDFLYQERVRTGDVSRFHKIVRADA